MFYKWTHYRIFHLRMYMYESIACSRVFAFRADICWLSNRANIVRLIYVIIGNFQAVLQGGPAQPV